MLLTFALLVAAICAVWLPDIRVGRHLEFVPWQALFIGAIASGLVHGVLAWPALLALAAAWGSAAASARAIAPVQRGLLEGLTVLLALALFVHVVPGFNHPVVARDIKLSLESVAFTQYARFDKGAAGVLLLGYYCRRTTRASEWPRAVMIGLAAGAAGAVVAIGTALATGAIAFDPKLPTFAPVWLCLNLFLTSVPEEALFRGFLQERLARQVAAIPALRWAPLMATSLLFGTAHAGGGPILVAAATLAGVAYGAAYQWSGRRIEAAVIAHLTLNAVHFFGFTYPYAER